MVGSWSSCVSLQFTHFILLLTIKRLPVFLFLNFISYLHFGVRVYYLLPSSFKVDILHRVNKKKQLPCPKRFMLVVLLFFFLILLEISFVTSFLCGSSDCCCYFCCTHDVVIIIAFCCSCCLCIFSSWLFGFQNYYGGGRNVSC